MFLLWLCDWFQFSILYCYWSKSDLSLAPIYWYVTEWEIWGSPHCGPHLSDLMSWIYSQTCPCCHIYL